MEPRYVHAPARWVMGLEETFTRDERAAIPDLWRRFVARRNELEALDPDVQYGVCAGSAEEGRFRYMPAVEVAEDAALPRGFTRRVLPGGRYAVFTVEGPLERLGQAVDTIFGTWLPASVHEQGEGPDFERYDERFDSEAESTIVEIWIPLRPA
jgi:AraC family transcriptional regulator